jgi:TRAP-type transport system periplasmic protein
MKKILFGLMMVIAILCLAACGSGGKEASTGTKSTSGETSGSTKAKVLKVGSVNNDKHTLFAGYTKFKEIVEEKTKGSVKVEIYPNGLLGNDRTMIEGLQLGTIESVGVSTSMLANWAPSMLAFDLPFTIQDEATADKVLDGSFGKKAAEQLEKENILLYGYMENGFRHLTNSKHEVKSVDDVKGLKIRTMQTPLNLATWEALGTNPTPLAYTELFTAMEQKVIDGQENPYGNMALDKFYEVQKYLTKTSHVYNPMGFVFSKKFMDTLGPEEQKVIEDAAQEASTFQRELNRKKSDEFLQTLVDNGMVVTELSKEAAKEFEESVQSVHKDFEEKIGKDYYDEYMAQIK